VGGIETLRRIHSDESGNTGEDLLDPDQPVFALGSVALADEEALTTLKTAGLGEFRDWKFKKLKRSGAGRRSIVSVIEQLAPQTSKYVAAHKPYMLVAKMVDDLLEPVLKDAGTDLYDMSGQVVIANQWFDAFPDALGVGLTEELYTKFVAMYRDRDDAAIDSFYTVLERLHSPASEPVATHIAALITSREFTTRILQDTKTTPEDVLDPQASLPMAMLAAWSEELEEPFVWVHDESNVVEKWVDQIRPFFFSDMPRQSVGYGGRAVTLPLYCAAVEFIKSESSPQVQVADLLAGAAAYWLSSFVRPAPNPTFVKQIYRAGILPLLSLAVWPEKGATPDEEDARTAFQSDPASAAAAFVRDWENRGR
jgi:hypothetical protein